MIRTDTEELRPGMHGLRQAVGAGYLLTSFIGRLPYAMNVVGVLTFVTVVRGSLAEGGIAAAALGLSAGLGGPLIGGAADRWGQRWVISVVALGNAAALVGVVFSVQAGLELPWVIVACVLAGVSAPQVAPFSRVRWIAVLAGHAKRSATPGHVNAAMGFEGMADEASFVLGPVLVGLLATALGPAAPIWGAVALVLTFVIVFAWHPTTALVGPASSGERSRLQALLSTRVVLQTAGMTAMGAVFGATLAALTQFMIARDLAEQVGLAYAALGLAAASTAFCVGLLTERIGLPSRWIAAAALLVIAALILPVVSSVPLMVVMLLVLGIAVGPIIVTVQTLAANSAPQGRIGTTMAMVGSGTIIGNALATAATSTVAGVYGFSAGAACVAVAAATCLVLAVVYRARHARSQHHALEEAAR